MKGLNFILKTSASFKPNTQIDVRIEFTMFNIPTSDDHLIHELGESPGNEILTQLALPDIWLIKESSVPKWSVAKPCRTARLEQMSPPPVN